MSLIIGRERYLTPNNPPRMARAFASDAVDFPWEKARNEKGQLLEITIP